MSARKNLLLHALIWLALILFGSDANAQTKKQIEHLDSYFAKSLEQYHVPGMAIAIVNREGIVFSKAYGYADIEKKQRVDGQTLFAVASNTKAFTAAALARLVEQHLLSWEDKVADHLPYFRLYDPYVSENITIEDLLCHRSGLKTFSGDLIWYGSDKSAEEVVRAAKYLKPSLPFRSGYGYSNIMYLAAGLIIEKVSGMKWSEFIRQEFLIPLQMDRTLTSVNDMDLLENVATPYYRRDGELIPLDWVNWDNMMAAGGLISSAHDMAKWLRLNINKGTMESVTLFSESSFDNMTTAHIFKETSAFNRKYQPNMHFKAYGLGWSMRDQHGVKLIYHSGGYDGMISRIWFAPEKGIGMVILTNSINHLPFILMEKSVDVLLADLLDGTDYAAMFSEMDRQSEMELAQKWREIEVNRKKILNAHLPLADYEGIYHDKIYGDVKVWQEEGQLYFSMMHTEIFHAMLNHWNGHIFTFSFPRNKSSLPPGKLWFLLSKDGRPEKLNIDVENPDFDFLEFSFIRKGD